VHAEPPRRCGCAQEARGLTARRALS
jgi:hypothetical protein